MVIGQRGRQQATKHGDRSVTGWQFKRRPGLGIKVTEVFYTSRLDPGQYGQTS